MAPEISYRRQNPLKSRIHNKKRTNGARLFSNKIPKHESSATPQDLLTEAISYYLNNNHGRAKIIFDIAVSLAEREDEPGFIKGLRLPIETKNGKIRVFEIGERIGSGGEAFVHFATDGEIDSAIKVSRLAISKRLEHEADLLSRIDSENVVHYIGKSNFFGRTFLSLEYLNGCELGEIIYESLSPSMIGFVVSSLCDALDSIHSKGIIHCDITPANIFCKGDRNITSVNLIDFGCSKQGYVSTNVLSGTIGYISPERVKGYAFDKRSDIFSVGVVLYQMITGINPFDSENARESFKKTIYHNPIPDYLSGESDKGLMNIALKAMSKSPDYRYPDAITLKYDLERVFERNANCYY